MFADIGAGAGVCATTGDRSSRHPAAPTPSPIHPLQVFIVVPPRVFLRAMHVPPREARLIATGRGPRCNWRENAVGTTAYSWPTSTASSRCFSCRPARSTVTVTGAALASRLVRSRILARSPAVVTAMPSTVRMMSPPDHQRLAVDGRGLPSALQPHRLAGRSRGDGLHKKSTRLRGQVEQVRQVVGQELTLEAGPDRAPRPGRLLSTRPQQHPDHQPHSAGNENGGHRLAPRVVHHVLRDLIEPALAVTGQLFAGPLGDVLHDRSRWLVSGLPARVRHLFLDVHVSLLWCSVSATTGMPCRRAGVARTGRSPEHPVTPRPSSRLGARCRSPRRARGPAATRGPRCRDARR